VKLAAGIGTGRGRHHVSGHRVVVDRPARRPGRVSVRLGRASPPGGFAADLPAGGEVKLTARIGTGRRSTPRIRTSRRGRSPCATTWTR